MSGKLISMLCAAALMFSGTPCLGNSVLMDEYIENEMDMPDISRLPKSIYVDGQVQHVQGIAYDAKADWTSPRSSITAMQRSTAGAARRKNRSKLAGRRYLC